MCDGVPTAAGFWDTVSRSFSTAPPLLQNLLFVHACSLTQENLMTHIPQSEQSMRSEQSMHGMHHSMQSCIQACMECHQVCLQTVMNLCLEMGGKHVEPEHLRLMMNCAEICQTSANFMLSSSTFHNRLCGVCAEVCDACGQDCKSIGDMDECVEACMNCAESCHQMAGSSMQH
jgi:hypothetical protein